MRFMAQRRGQRRLADLTNALEKPRKAQWPVFGQLEENPKLCALSQ
jgi:hypothetical protein